MRDRSSSSNKAQPSHDGLIACSYVSYYPGIAEPRVALATPLHRNLVGRGGIHFGHTLARQKDRKKDRKRDSDRCSLFFFLLLQIGLTVYLSTSLPFLRGQLYITPGRLASRYSTIHPLEKTLLKTHAWGRPSNGIICFAFACRRMLTVPMVDTASRRTLTSVLCVAWVWRLLYAARQVRMQRKLKCKNFLCSPAWLEKS